MHDDTLANNLEQESANNSSAIEADNDSCSHQFLEVDADLLSKPSILVQLIEHSSYKPTLIFCNAPSEADFIDVILRKRGVPTRKLIGHVPSMKVKSVLDQVKANEVVALVVTDISAREIETGNFGLVISNSVPNDPAAYMERAAKSLDLSDSKALVSLVAPIDIGHFHYLKKVSGANFVKIEVPSDEGLATKRFERLLKMASATTEVDAKVKTLADLLLDDSKISAAERGVVVAYLIHNTLNVLPGAAPADGGRDSGEQKGRNGRPYRDHRDRGDRMGSGDRNGSPRGDFNADEMTLARRATPAQKEARIYVGQGSSQGLNAPKLTEMVKEVLSSTSQTWDEGSLRRVTVRGLYSFIDVPEELSESVMSGLSSQKVDGDNLFVRKAVTISSRRDEGDSDDHQPEGDNFESNEHISEEE